MYPNGNGFDMVRLVAASSVGAHSINQMYDEAENNALHRPQSRMRMSTIQLSFRNMINIQSYLLVKSSLQGRMTRAYDFFLARNSLTNGKG